MIKVSVGEHSMCVECVGWPSLERMEKQMEVEVTIRGARIPPAASPRFPGQCQSSRGQSGPKSQPNGEGDGRTGQHSRTTARSDVETEQWNLRALTE